MMRDQFYRAKEFNLSGLNGISDRTVDMHIALYKGYVKNTNLLLEQLNDLTKERRATASDPAYAELRRHLGFEYGGMLLHEYYFGNLAAQGRGQPSKALKEAVEESFGDFEAWKQDFAAVGKLRGVGWAILYEDPATGLLSNHWITLHDQGVPPGLTPVLVMDMWEHAFLLDYAPSEKGQYIDAFFSNIDWVAVDERLRTPLGTVR